MGIAGITLRIELRSRVLYSQNETSTNKAKQRTKQAWNTASKAKQRRKTQTQDS